MRNIGFIGCGNMASAMIGGIVNSKLFSPQSIIASDRNKEKLRDISLKHNINITLDSKEVTKNSDVIVIAIKPNGYDEVLHEIKDYINDKIIVAIAAGKTIKNIEDVIGDDKKIIRSMPNTPALVNEGMSAICKNDNISDREINMIKVIFDCFGKTEIVEEKLIDAVIGVSGSSPAYVFMMIEAMADAAVLNGMSREMSYKFAAQAVMGSAKMVLETNLHPAILKDMVCSPAGTTIEGVKTLEEEGFRSSIIKATVNCVNKSIEMNKK